MLRRADAWLSFLFFMAGLSLIAAPRVAQAQAFGFSIGSGGSCHHHHRGGWWAGYGFAPYWGPGYYGPSYYGPPAVVYAPPPVVQERVIYVPPSAPAPLPPATPYTTSAAPPAPLPATGGASLASTTANDDRIVIRNAAGARLPVSFLVDGQDVELADGSTRTFVGKTQRTVQFDRGGRFGSTQQELTGGQYEFRVTASGWDLVRRPDILSSRTAIRANSLPEAGVTR